MPSGHIWNAVALLWLSGAQSIRGTDIDTNAPFLKFFGNTIKMGGANVTYGSLLMIVVFLVLWYMLNKTAWGRHVYAVGDIIGFPALASTSMEQGRLAACHAFGVQAESLPDLLPEPFEAPTGWRGRKDEEGA